MSLAWEGGMLPCCSTLGFYKAKLLRNPNKELKGFRILCDYLVHRHKILYTNYIKCNCWIFIGYFARTGVGDPGSAASIPTESTCVRTLDPPHGNRNGVNDDKQSNRQHMLGKGIVTWSQLSNRQHTLGKGIVTWSQLSQCVMGLVHLSHLSSQMMGC